VSDQTSKTLAPAYVPYATFMSALDNLRTHGIPNTGIIDKSLWDTQSGAIQGQLLLTFKFLGLIDEQNRVLPPLPVLSKASGEDRKVALKPIIEEKYKQVIALGLSTISPGQLDEAFRKLNVNGSTLIRAVRFFVKACQECGIPISKRIVENARSSAVTALRRPKKNGGGKREPDEQHTSEEVRVSSSIEDKLLAKFPEFDPNWPDQLKAKWFEGFERLMKSSLGEQKE